MHRPRARSGLLAAAVAVALLGVAAVALAKVTIYTNDFSSRSEFQELKRAGGRHCDRNYRRKKSVLRQVVLRAPERCALTPPVAGDGPRPDHIFQAQGKVAKTTSQRTRRKAYMFIAVRVGGSGRYELRIFPKKKRFELRRSPGGGGFPVNGTTNAINRVGRRNKLRLQAIGDTVKGFVNGKKIGSVTDGSPSDVKGAKLEVGLGNAGNSHKPTEGTFNSLRLAVPNP